MNFILALIGAYFSSVGLFFISQDYITYRSFFQDTDLGGFGIFFQTFAVVSKWIFDDFRALIFVVSFISLYIKLNVLSRVKINIPIRLLYLSTLYFYYECLRIRYALAISLLMWSVYKCRKKVYIIIVQLFSYLCHITVIVFIPFYWLSQIVSYFRLQQKDIVFVYALIYCLVLANLALFFHNLGLTSYIENNPDYFNVWGIPRQMLVAILLFSLNKRNRDTKEKNAIYTFCCFIYIISLATYLIPYINIALLDTCLILSISNKDFIYDKKTTRIIILIFFEMIVIRVFCLPHTVLYFIKTGNLSFQSIFGQKYDELQAF